MNAKTYDPIDEIIRYESGEATAREEIEHFQALINTGQAWSLQGSYGRRATELIEAGLCTLGEVGHRDYWGNYIPSKYEVKPGTKGSKAYCEQRQQQR